MFFEIGPLCIIAYFLIHYRVLLFFHSVTSLFEVFMNAKEINFYSNRILSKILKVEGFYFS